MPSYLTTARKTQTVSQTTGTTFGQQLDIAARRGTDQMDVSLPGATVSEPGAISLGSPYISLKESYWEWRAQQPEQELPDSYNAAEENLAYLKERYTGDLSWEERMDALNTMVEMGVITQDQMDESMGVQGPIISHSLDEVRALLLAEVERTIAYLDGGWDAYFANNAISKFKTADDLFAWLDDIS